MKPMAPAVICLEASLIFAVFCFASSPIFKALSCMAPFASELILEAFSFMSLPASSSLLPTLVFAKASVTLSAVSAKALACFSACSDMALTEADCLMASVTEVAVDFICLAPSTIANLRILPAISSAMSTSPVAFVSDTKSTYCMSGSLTGGMLTPAPRTCSCKPVTSTLCRISLCLTVSAFVFFLEESPPYFFCRSWIWSTSLFRFDSRDSFCSKRMIISFNVNWSIPMTKALLLSLFFISEHHKAHMLISNISVLTSIMEAFWSVTKPCGWETPALFM
mmetsp:Transcript_62800/g.119334  ORF Transcript_62800/g.119334 Transcript_62800/m.119334 type:complete len:280 (-) Transcript_62800:470-1309(-)